MDSLRTWQSIAVFVLCIVLLLGGLFLLYKASHEIFVEVEAQEEHGPGEETPAVAAAKGKAKFWGVIGQIAIIDIVFSLDSVITAVGMVNLLPAMIGAIVLAVLVMIFVADPIGNFIDRNPTIKMLALAFIILVGVVLLCDGIGVHVGRGYLYFAMAFSAAVESLNLYARRRRRQRKAA